MKDFIILIFASVLIVLALVGEVLCIYKATKCNWKPIDKAEVIYTIGAFTGAGAVIGFFDIKDN